MCPKRRELQRRGGRDGATWVGGVGIIVSLWPCAAAAQERQYEWGWGMHHPMMGGMWGAWGLGMMLMMLVFRAAVIVGINKDEFEAKRRDLM